MYSALFYIYKICCMFFCLLYIMYFSRIFVAFTTSESNSDQILAILSKH